MSFGIIQHLVITMRNNDHRKQRSRMDRSQMPIVLQRGGLNELKQRFSEADRLRLRRRIRSQNKRNSQLTWLMTLAAMSVLIIGVAYYLNGSVQ